MILNYKKPGKGEPLIILHGLLGMLDNWHTIGKNLSQFYQVYLVDARNHGHSPHSGIFNYEVMCDDIIELMENEKIESTFLLGHSMGGKTAMTLAQKYPEKISKLVVVDISPKKYPPTHENIFEALSEVNFNLVKSRKEVEEKLSKHIQEEEIRQFILKNLFWKESGMLAWRFNLPVIQQSLELVSEPVLLGIFEQPALFLKGEKSNYLNEQDKDLIKKHFPKSEIITIQNAGHWVHAGQPELFLKTVLAFLQK